MKRTLFVALFLILALTSSGYCDRSTGKIKIYDNNHRLKYRIDNGKIYDDKWKLKGRIQNEKIYDKEWNRKGDIEGVK
jgi:hypothetical protein